MAPHPTEPEAPAADATDDARGRLLAEAGLSRYEVRIFLAAFGRGACAAKDLARLSGVPRTRVYDVLASLAARGLVEEHEGAHRTFVARSPRAFLEREAHEASVRAEALERLVAERVASPPTLRGDTAPFRLIEGPVAEGHAIAETLAEASSSLFLDIHADTLATWLEDDTIAPALRRALGLPTVVAGVAGDASRLVADPGLARAFGARAPTGAGVERIVIDGRVVLLRVARASTGADLLVAEHAAWAREEAAAVATLHADATPARALAVTVGAGARGAADPVEAREAIAGALAQAASNVTWFGPWPEDDFARCLAERAAAGVGVRILGPPRGTLFAPPIEARVAEAEAPFVVVDARVAVEPRGDVAFTTALPGRARLFLAAFERRWLHADKRPSARRRL